MASPLLIGGAVLLGHAAVERIAGGLLHPVDSYIASQYEPGDYNRKQNAWYDNPDLLPSPEILFELLNREMTYPGWAEWALLNHGIRIKNVSEGFFNSVAAAELQLWKDVANLKKKRPGIDWVLDAWMRDKITEADAKIRIIQEGGDWFKLADMMPTRRSWPGEGDCIDAWQRGRIDDTMLNFLLTKAGADPSGWEQLLDAKQPLPAIGELLVATNRGILSGEDLHRWLGWHGFKDPEAHEIYDELLKGIPQVADLVMMGIREAFRPELAQVYDYYSEFPELTRPWFAKLGLNYPVGIQINPQTGPREATLADLYWAAHWHPMPLGQAYAAYQRFRPDAMARYQNENPNIKPFTRDDLILHMRIADLPPGVRDWMVALGHQPLGIRAIQWGVRYLDKDADWAAERYLDQGYVLEDAVTQAKIQVAREEERQRAWITSLEQAANKKLVALTESLYRDGLIDRDQATRRLTQMGIPDLSAIQILDLQELEVKHTLIVSAVAATRRAFLSGEILAADVPTQLGRFGVLPFRAQLYLQTWQIQFTSKRKRLETGKIAAMVVEGLMSAADAKVRLGNLGWSDPDATLLLAEAAGKIRKLQAAEVKAGESAAQRRARELERLAKQADAQARKLRSEANRVAPRSVLMRWAKEHEIGEDSFRSMMRERGYPEGDIDLYWQEVVTPKPRAPRPAPTVRPFPRPPGSVHPTEAMLGKWYLTETIGRTEYVDALKSLGYTPEDAERIAYNDDLKHGKAGTTEEPPAPPPAS